MVHVRLNETEANPNPHINFITPLSSVPEIQEEAKQLLRALAAQVRPVMKSHGFAVNSFEEYEFNQVFAGRNWNNGETVEIVLRRPGGEFYPTSWLMSTLCHELAHIKHMNHGPAFQALWKRLRIAVRQLQDRGYYGDGYWSSGQRLADSARIPGDGIEAGDFPEYMCGGAQQRSRPTARRRRAGVARGKRREVVPSLHTGRQTAIKRKAGGRVTSKYAFTGEGKALGSESVDGSKGKRAGSNKAREERALAAERRMQAMLGGPSSVPTPSTTSRTNPDESDEDEEAEIVGETDAERREALLASNQENDDPDFLGSGKGWKTFEGDFDFTRPKARMSQKNDAGGGSKHPDTFEFSSEDEGGADACDVPIASGSASTTGQIRTLSSTRDRDVTTELKGKNVARGNNSHRGPGMRNLVQSEIDLRKKESLGLAPIKGVRTIGGKPRRPSTPPSKQQGEWSCQICTLINNSQHLACSACATPRGEVTWAAAD